jgi:hypothetical protein
VSRPVTRFKCRWVPNRSPKRRITRDDAARFVCYAIKGGARKHEIDREVERRCAAKAEKCDCESVLLTLRQVLVISAAVALALFVVRFAAAALPAILSIIAVRLLPRAVQQALPGIARAAKEVTDQSRVIEGTFRRVRDTVVELERALVR